MKRYNSKTEWKTLGEWLEANILGTETWRAWPGNEKEKNRKQN